MKKNKPEEEVFQEDLEEKDEIVAEEKPKAEVKEKPKAKPSNGNGNGHSDSSEIMGLLRKISLDQKELSDRLEEVEKKAGGGGTSADALIRMVNLTYDTDDKHLPELTRIPIQAARPHALGMMLESILDEDVQSGEVPLSKKLRNSYFRLMRSVGGVHLGRGVRLAEEQASAETEKAEEMELGGEE